MELEEYLKSLNIDNDGYFSENNAYVIDLLDSDEYGRIYSTLEKADDLSILEENQVVTLQGSSLIYESNTEPYMFNLIADFDANRYQLIVNNLK